MPNNTGKTNAKTNITTKKIVIKNTKFERKRDLKNTFMDV